MFFLQKITLALSFQSGTIISTLVFLRGRPLVTTWYSGKEEEEILGGLLICLEVI